MAHPHFRLVLHLPRYSRAVLAIGSYLLSLESPWVRQKMLQMQRRYPKLSGTLEEARIRAARYARKILGKGK